MQQSLQGLTVNETHMSTMLTKDNK